MTQCTIQSWYINNTLMRHNIFISFYPYRGRRGRACMVVGFTTAVSFIGGGNQRTRRKPPTCHKSLTNFII
jgi:hypothetical protein